MDAGVTSVATPREAAQQCDVVISCVFDDKSVVEISQGKREKIEKMFRFRLSFIQVTVVF